MKIFKNRFFKEKMDLDFFFSHEWRSTAIENSSILSLWSKPAKNIINYSNYLYTIK